MPKSKSSRTIVTVQLSTEAAQRLLKQWKAQDPRMLRWLAYYGLKVEDIQPGDVIGDKATVDTEVNDG